MSSFAENLKKFRKQAGLTQKQLADKSGVKQSTISEIETGVTLKTASIVDLANALGVSSEELQTGSSASKIKVLDVEDFRKKHNIVDDANSVKFVEIQPVKTRGFFKRWVPVKAYSKMGNDGYFMDMYGEGNGGDGYIPTHSAGINAYGVKGTGDSMFPAIRNGWYVVCDPDAEPTPMEFVQVCLKDGRCTIKEFIGIQNGVLNLLAVNGGERLTFDMDEVQSIAAITDIIPPSQHRQEHPDTLSPY